MSMRLAPSTTPDTAFFWDGLEEHKLLIQRCASCDRVRHPPRPMCPWCNSLEREAIESAGRGTVHSFVMPQHPQFPFMEYPHIVALVELDEGPRLISNLVDIAPHDATIGMVVEVCFVAFENTASDVGLVLHQFRPVTGS